MSVAAYHLLSEAGVIPQNTELLHGLVYYKMSKSPLHCTLLRRMIRLLNKSLPPGFFVNSEMPITCVDSEPEPDAAIIKGSEDDFDSSHPQTAELVIEVCVTSHEYDHSKLSAYASAGVKECWFVLGDVQKIEVYRDPVERAYTQFMILGPEGSISSAVAPANVIALKEIFKGA